MTYPWCYRDISIRPITVVELQCVAVDIVSGDIEDKLFSPPFNTELIEDAKIGILTYTKTNRIFNEGASLLIHQPVTAPIATDRKRRKSPLNMLPPTEKLSLVLSSFDEHDRLKTHSNQSEFSEQLTSESGSPEGEFIFYIKESQGGFWLTCSEKLTHTRTLMKGTLEYDFQWKSPRLQTKLDEIVDSLDTKHYFSNTDMNSIASIHMKQPMGKNEDPYRGRMAPPPSNEDVVGMINTGIALVDTVQRLEQGFEGEVDDVSARDVKSISRK